MSTNEGGGRYDVIYGPGPNICRVEPHHCREWEEDERGEVRGCYGTNPNHGFSWDAARAEVSAYYARLSKEWADKQEGDAY